MIRCKLISPTNLMLEHPLYLAPHDAAEFFVIGRKEYNRIRMSHLRVGIVVGASLAVGAVGLISLVLAALR